MRAHRIILSGMALSLSGFLCGCADTERHGDTSPYHPGPAAGQNVGAAVGVTAGNVAGAVVGTAQGVGAGLAAPFDPEYHMVRHWRTETTSDGRTIQVPYDVLVDKYGRPVPMPAPSGNPGPPTSTNAPPPQPPPPLSNP